MEVSLDNDESMGIGTRLNKHLITVFKWYFDRMKLEL